MLPHQADAIASLAGDDGDAARQWLSALHRPLLAPRGEPFRLLMVGDCLMGEIQTFLQPLAADRNLAIDFRTFYFSSVTGADIESDGIKAAVADGVDAIAASYLSYQGTPLYRSLLENADTLSEDDVVRLVDGIVEFMRNHLGQMRALTNVPILLHNASGIPLTRWRRLLPILAPLSQGRRRVLARLNPAVAELASNTENCILVNETAVTAAAGLRRAAQPMVARALRRRAHFHHSWFSHYAGQAYADIVADLALLRKTKVLLLDFDNTLWDGVMADGPVVQHHDRQNLLRRLAEQGIVLCAVSKNDPANIRWEEMTLQPEHFAALKINWHLKVQSIRELVAELNLGLDAFLLLDDHQSERAMVSAELPAVRVLDSTQAATWQTIERLFAMPNTTQTEEARQRTAMYRQQAERAGAIKSAHDYPAMMRTLGLKASIGAARPGDIERVTELVQRTNQFNTTTIRYSRGEIEALARDPNVNVLVGELGDRVGDLGLVGVVIVRGQPESAVIDSFIMSCRAMGFGFEHALLAAAVEAAGSTTITARFVPSDRNEPASGLFAAAGFAQVAAGEWRLPAGSSLRGPEWIEVTRR